MPDRPRSAAASLYPHLKSGMAEPVQRQREPASVADAMFGHLRPPTPQPKPNRASTDLRTLCDQNPQLEWLMALCGLRRVR
jgi:hypothetical protein